MATVLCAVVAVPLVGRYRERFQSSGVVYQVHMAAPESVAAQSDGAGADPMVLEEMLLEEHRLSLLVEALGLYPNLVAQSGMTAAVAELRRNVTFKALGKATFRISFVGDSAAQAQAVTARLTDSLVQEDRTHRTEQAHTSESFLAAEMGRADLELKSAEQDLEAFLAAHPEFSLAVLPDSEASPAATRRLRASARQGADPGEPDRSAQSEPMQAKGAAPSSASPRAPATYRQDPDPGLVAERRAALAELAQATAELGEMQRKYTDNHPSVMAAQSKVTTAELRVDAANDAVKADLANRVDAKADEPAPPAGSAEAPKRWTAPARPAQAEAPKKLTDTATQQPPDAKERAALEAQWTRLAREVSHARKQHERLADEAFRAQVASRSLTEGYAAGVVVLEAASMPDRPIRPRSVFVALGAFAAVAAGMLFAFARAALDNRVYDESDLIAFELEPILAMIPRHVAQRAPLARSRKKVRAAPVRPPPRAPSPEPSSTRHTQRPRAPKLEL